MGEYEPILRASFRRPKPISFCLSLAGTAVIVAACATPEPGGSLADKDRFNRFNEASYNTYERVDRAIVRPVARGYDALPDKIKGRVSNFFDNLHGPIDISNNLLQGKFKRGFSSLGRLLVNSTIGLGGLFDPASRMGIPRYLEDFGQTLAVWGVPSGPYLYLPVVGPTTARDLLGITVDWQYNPITQYDDSSTRNSLIVLEKIEQRSAFVSPFAEGARERASDPYDFVRSAYEQARDEQIFDGNPPDIFESE